MSAPPVRVLVADDDAAVRSALRALLRARPGFEVVAEVADGSAAVEGYRAHRPELVLMDLQMPVLTGIEATAQICAEFPGACVLALTTFGTRDYVVAALRAGAAGYLLKDAGPENLLAGMHQALRGDMPLSSAVRRQLVASVLTEAPVRADVALTPREQELLDRLAEGLTNQQIARRMHLSEGSVKQYLGHVGDKLGVRSRTQILVRAIRLGLVRP